MTATEYNKVPKIGTNNPGVQCALCGNEFSNPKNSIRRRQVVWVRKLIRVAGDLYRIHGSVDATCNDKLNTMQVAQLTN